MPPSYKYDDEGHMRASVVDCNIPNVLTPFSRLLEREPVYERNT